MRRPSENRKPNITDKITALPGIGPKKAELFGRLGVFTVLDLLNHFPRAYQNRGNVRLISQRDEGMSSAFVLTVGTKPRTVTLKNRRQFTKFSAFDESGKTTVCFFNSRFVEDIFAVGETFRFWGNIKKGTGGLMMTSPSYEPFSEKLPPLVPVYPTTEGLSQNAIAKAVSDALSFLSPEDFPEIMPAGALRELELVPAFLAYRFIHTPKDYSSVNSGSRYFAARQSFIFSLAITRSRLRAGYKEYPVMFPQDITPYTETLGFSLTGAQKRSIDEIASDMTGRGKPMSRLLSGDVGSGKTAVAGGAIYICVKNGFQAALMAPTEILARQHYSKLSVLFEKLGYTTVLLVGSLKASEKKKAAEKIANGDADIVIGTHALISKGVDFARPGLVITDEQHRFGVTQRAVLGEGGDFTPHVLVMSATPIPRTMGLILYGELAVSSLDELPPGRQTVKTYSVGFDYRERLIAFIRKQAQNGGRTYIVCPAIAPPEEEEEIADCLDLSASQPKLKTAAETFDELKTELDDIGVAIVHGDMKAADKENAMNEFASGEKNVLVCTTVIEVGVDVPQATVMIVLNAERFGLATLHQLRGRVGRGKAQSYCVLVSDASGDAAKKRLDVMVNETDGFKIAEYDLQLRGPGDYLGSSDGRVRQHGDFSALDLADMDLLKKTMAIAQEVLSADPSLASHPQIRAALDLNYIDADRMFS